MRLAGRLRRLFSTTAPESTQGIFVVAVIEPNAIRAQLDPTVWILERVAQPGEISPSYAFLAAPGVLGDITTIVLSVTGSVGAS